MVKIKLDKERTLKLTMRGMLTFEEKTGINLFKGIDLANMSLRELSVLLWVCLIHEDKELQFEDFTDLVDLSNIVELTTKVTECIKESFPDTDGESPLVETSQAGSACGRLEDMTSDLIKRNYLT